MNFSPHLWSDIEENYINYIKIAILGVKRSVLEGIIPDKRS